MDKVKRIVRIVVLTILLVAVLTVISAMSIKFLDYIFNTNIEDIWSTGFRISVVTSILLIMGEHRKNKKKKFEGENK